MNPPNPTHAACSICVLGSGSRGNCIYFRAGDHHCLIDAGMSYREIRHRLMNIGIPIEAIQNVFITHEHNDHISALKTLTQKHSLRLFCTPKTYLQIAHQIHPQTHLHLTDGEKNMNGLTVTPFAISHDAVDPVGYSFRYHHLKISMLTDLGVVTTNVIRTVSDSHVLIVEANHDETMLWNGSYSEPLKRRIAGEYGHLSNRQTVELISHMAHPHLQFIFLAHLSRENNQPTLAFTAVNNYLKKAGLTMTRLLLTDQFQNSTLINVSFP